MTIIIVLFSARVPDYRIFGRSVSVSSAIRSILSQGDICIESGKNDRDNLSPVMDRKLLIYFYAYRNGTNRWTEPVNGNGV